jgi:gamma-glutamyltranspeptidase/glutathione hydrolase
MALGGTGQAQTQLQLLTNLIDFENDVQQAIEAPRWVSGGTLVGESIEALRLENRFPRKTKKELRRLGYSLAQLGNWSDRTGHAQAIVIDPQQQFLLGGADPRSEGIAAGW